MGEESPYGEWLANWERDDRRIETHVPCADYFPTRDAALLAHATQIDPDGAWFRVPLDQQAAAWPTEDFELARSFVPVSEPEDDLFAGIPADAPSADALATSGTLDLVHDELKERS